MSCELCNLEKKTKWYYEDERFVVCDCETCKVPMIVLKRHSTELNQEELIDLMWILTNAIPKYDSRGLLAVRLDQNRRKISDHWHAHIR